jgi:PAS domain S-box-containing protein
MPSALIPRPSRVVVLSIVIAGASGVAGLLEPVMGNLSLVPVVLFTYIFGRRFGRLAAGFASLGIAGAMLGSHQPSPPYGSISRCAVAIAAAWLCAELFSRRPRQPGSTARVKDRAFDGQLRQRNQTLQSISNLFPGHVWTALPDGSIEYLSPGLCEYTGIKEARDCDFFRAAMHPDDQHANDRYRDALRAGSDPGELEFRLRRIDGEYRWFLCRVKAIRSDSGQLLHGVGVCWDIHARKTAEDIETQNRSRM